MANSANVRSRSMFWGIERVDYKQKINRYTIMAVACSKVQSR